MWYNSCEGLGVLWELVILHREKSVAIHQSVTCFRQLHPTTTCPQWQMSLCFMSLCALLRPPAIAKVPRPQKTQPACGVRHRDTSSRCYLAFAAVCLAQARCNFESSSMLGIAGVSLAQAGCCFPSGVQREGDM